MACFGLVAGACAPADPAAVVRVSARPATSAALVQEAARSFYQRQATRVHAAPGTTEQLVLWIDPALFVPGVFFLPVRSAVPGLGRAAVDESSTFGAAELAGVIAVGTGWSEALGDPDAAAASPDALLGKLLHETVHQWAASLLYQMEGGAASAALLGRQGAHWSFFLRTGGSPMGGNDWRALDAGRFTAMAPQGVRLCALDLYTMGVLPASAVGPIELLRPRSPCVECFGERATQPLTLEAQVERVDIEAITAVHGPRPPADPKAPLLRQTWLVLSPESRALDPALLARLARLRLRWQALFASATRGLAAVEVILPGSDG